MSRIVGSSRRPDRYGSQMRLSETAIFIAIGIALILAVRWYFVVYRNSPGVALSAYLGAVKAGNASAQYDLIDDADKKLIPSEKEYEKLPMAVGYTERISGIELEEPVADSHDADVTAIKATISVRGTAQGKELYQTGQTQTASDTYTLRKDSSGHWKVWLEKSPMTNLLKITPNPPGSSF